MSADANPDMNPSTSLDRSGQPGGQRVGGLPDHVVIRQLYLGCLSQASYLVGDSNTGRAIAVDPRRDIDEMLDAASAEGLVIEMVVETHFHADFLSGHLELAAATGAEIGFGEAARTDFESRGLADGELIDLGGVQVEVLSTPGHTPESISLVVRPAPEADPVAALTGDTLFIGDVGRPDLLVAANVSAEHLAGRLFQSVHRLLALPDSALVLPAHGAGSACGKSLSAETVSTIGEQRRTNYALQPMSEETFVGLVTEDQPSAPAYFGFNADLNRREHPLLDEHEAVTPLTLDELDRAVASGAAVVDTRPVEAFAQGHLAGSLSVSLTGRFAEQVGSVVNAGTAIVLLGSPEAVTEAKVRLGRIGFDNVVGAITGPEALLVQHPERARRLSRLTAREFVERRADLGDDLQLIDVRNPGEVKAAPIGGANNIPLARLRGDLGQLDPQRPVVLMCAGGARSAIASSVLWSAGFLDVSDVVGGANALDATASGHNTPAP
ncbi:MAG TPA: rhodanese-like domain-containing protein [Ilumatobacter sp.]|nr:rhodanese-like domain-containing protein [Ilumatobacter sp.]